MQDDNLTFRKYVNSDCNSCLSLFDQNCPKFFAENERTDFEEYLSTSCEHYEVGIRANEVVAAFGFSSDLGTGRGRISWIMVSPFIQGGDVGSRIMNRVLELAKGCQVAVIDIAASHISAPFFAKFGAKEVKITQDGWGLGMHKVDMELLL